MTRTLPGPTDEVGDLRGRFLDYLDYFRATVGDKLDGLDDAELHAVRLPSDWAPLELVTHLIHMEQRWIRWGFAAEQIDEPWGDHDEHGRWYVRPHESLSDLLAALHATGERTRTIVEDAELDDRAGLGGRFAHGTHPPTLAGILFHVLQEYARHVGHLDIVCELADGTVGE